MRIIDLVEVVRRAPVVIPQTEGDDCLYRNYLAQRFLEEYKLPTTLAWGTMRHSKGEYGYLGYPYFAESGFSGHFWLVGEDGAIYDASTIEHEGREYKQFGTGVPYFCLPEFCERLYQYNRERLFKELKSRLAISP